MKDYSPKINIPFYSRVMTWMITLLEISICHSIYLLSSSLIFAIITYLVLVLSEAQYLIYRIPKITTLLLTNQDKAHELETKIKPEIAGILLAIMVVVRYFAM